LLSSAIAEDLHAGARRGFRTASCFIPVATGVASRSTTHALRRPQRRGDLISEAALAIEMGCEAEDVGLTVHPHPTLSETFAFSAEAFAGTLRDLYMPKKR